MVEHLIVVQMVVGSSPIIHPKSACDNYICAFHLQIIQDGAN